MLVEWYCVVSKAAASYQARTYPYTRGCSTLAGRVSLWALEERHDRITCIRDRKAEVEGMVLKAKREDPGARRAVNMRSRKDIQRHRLLSLRKLKNRV